MRLSPFLLVVFLISLVFFRCTSVKYSNAVKGEQRKMNPVTDENKDVFASAKLSDQSEGGRGADAILGSGVSLAVSGIKSLINADKKKYAVEYDGVLNELYFYSRISSEPDGILDPSGMQFKGFEFCRLVEKDGKRIKSDTALYARFVLDMDDPYEIVNNSIFRLKLDYLKVNYSKAKIPGHKWYVPWTWFSKNIEKLDLDFDVVIKGTWFSKDGTFYENVPLGKFNQTVRKLPLNIESQKTFLRDPGGPLHKRMAGYSLLVPRSFSSTVAATRGGKPTYDNSFGKGLYRIDIKIKEQSKPSYVMKSFYDNSDSYIDQAVKLIKK